MAVRANYPLAPINPLVRRRSQSDPLSVRRISLHELS